MMMIDDDFRTVVISYSAEGSISSDNRDDYPYFFRTIAENKQYKWVLDLDPVILDCHKQNNKFFYATLTPWNVWSFSKQYRKYL